MGNKEYLVIPPGPGRDVLSMPNNERYLTRRRIFSDKRKAEVYDNYWQHQKVIHFISDPKDGYRLLQHFYTFIHFDDEKMDRWAFPLSHAA